MDNISQVIQAWSTKEKFPLRCFDGWLNKFKDLIRQQLTHLELKYKAGMLNKSLFSDSDVKEELDFLHKYFVKQ